MARVFISHSHRDKPTAKQVSAYLKENSADVWIDDEKILVGDSIQEKIGEGIQSSDFVLVLLSSQSVKSGWVKREIEANLGEEISTGKVKVLGVLCEKLDGTWSIPPLLAGKKYADLSHDFTLGMKEVIMAIRGHVHGNGPPHIPPVIRPKDRSRIKFTEKSENPNPLTFETAERHITIGRGPNNSIRIRDQKVSWEHAQITLTQGGYLYCHLSTRNPSKLRRKGEEHLLRSDIKKEIELKNQDRLIIGDMTILVEFDLMREDAGYTTTVKDQSES